MRSTDRGDTWQDHRPGAHRDVHSLAWHPRVPQRAYEAGGEGAAWSEDGGATWKTGDEGRVHRYTWSVTVDPDDPERLVRLGEHGAVRGARRAAIRRRPSTDVGTETGSDSAGSPTRCRRCRTRSLRPRTGSSPASPAASSGRAGTAATPGGDARCSGTGSRDFWLWLPCLGDGEPEADPAATQTVNAIQWIPITSVCRPMTSTVASAAASHAFRRHSPVKRATFHRTNASMPAIPASTPELGLRRLARLDLDTGALRDDPGVAEPMPLWVSSTTRTP